MSLRGEHFVAGVAEAWGGEPFTAFDPTSGEALAPQFREATPTQVDAAFAAAA